MSALLRLFCLGPTDTNSPSNGLYEKGFGTLGGRLACCLGISFYKEIVIYAYKNYIFILVNAVILKLHILINRKKD